MMSAPRFVVLVVAVSALSACGQSAPIAARSDHAALVFYNDHVEEGSVAQQLEALQALADDLVVKSSVNGALVGAAMGCGLAVVSTGNVSKCATSAAVGAAGGAIAGRAAGQQSVKRRIALVSEPEVSRGLRTTARQLETLRTDLPKTLRAQENRLNDLMMQRASGEISQAEHDRGVAKVKAERAALAEALSLSEADMRRAARNLQTAAKRGQSGLDWHIRTANQLADDVASQRSSISLL